MRLHGIGAVEIRAGPRAAADGLVVLMLVIAEREVVHGALAGREHAERAIEAICHDLRSFDIAGDDRGRISRRQHRTFGHDEVQRLHAAGVHRDLVIHQRAEHVQHRGARHRQRRVEVVGLLRARAGEVDGGFASRMVDANRDANHGAVVHLAAELRHP